MSVDPAVEIVKPAVDVGIQTNDWPAHEAFWAHDLGLPFDHLLKIRGGIHQHRFHLGGAILKVNDHRDALPTGAPTGWTALGIVDDDHRGPPEPLPAPDDLAVARFMPMTPPLRTYLQLEATDVDRTLRVLGDALGLVPSGTRVELGETRIGVREADRPPTGARDGVGIRYVTVQVRDVRAAHAQALDAGMTEGMAPLRLGDTAFISFVRLPDGDWIELSQRASLTGPLPDDAPRA